MRSTVRLLTLTALALLLTVLAPPGARGQAGNRMETMVNSMIGAGGEVPAARLIFLEKEERVCLTIAVLTGPTALKTPLFRFARRVEGEPKSQRITFALPKKPESATQQGLRIQVWEGCAPSDAAPAVDSGAAALIDIEYHDRASSASAPNTPSPSRPPATRGESTWSRIRPAT